MSDTAAADDVGLDSLVARVVDEFRERQACGERPDAEEYAARHPEAAELLRKVLAALEVVGLSGSAAASALPGEPVAGVLGDFRLIREVGRGGMGVVYEAEQVSLGRRVALKVLPFAATMDPRQLQRFHNEARAAASLHHEHIVPVFAVGCERAVHFYAMQFIEGKSLADLIAAPRPQMASAPGSHSAATAPAAVASTEAAPRDAAYCRRVAAWGVQAAEALEHAHALGIVHRDVKPANLIVDGQGKLWVTDFGLAHTATDAGLTMTGDLLGTLRYMSPEQALAKHGLVEHRTDIYSLGATLYELLTGRPAVEGHDRQEILRRIADEEPRPPRAIEGALPADLATIVLKALAKEPAERYATARELSDDLRRYLEDRPILARPPGLSQRLRRWSRRHRTLVATTVVGLFVSVVALAISTAVIWHKQRETAAAYEAAKEQRQEAVEQRQEAIDSLKDAQAAVDQFLSRVGGKRLADVPYMEPLRRDLLADALRFYQKFLQKKNADPELRLEVARAYIRIGDIQQMLGELDPAEENLRQGLALLQELFAQEPSRTDRREEQAEAWLHLGRVRLSKDDKGKAEEAFKQAREIAAQVVADSPDSRGALHCLARAHAELGTTYARGGRLPQAAEAFREALGWGEKLTAASPDDLDFKQTLATVTANLGKALAGLGNQEEGEKRFRQALELQENIVSRDSSPGHRVRLADCYRDLGLGQGTRGQLKEAAATNRKALDLYARIHAEFPHVPDYVHRHARMLFFAGKTLMFLGSDATALDYLSEGERLYTQLVKEFPANKEYARELTWCCFERGWLLAASYNAQVRNPAAAIDPARKAVQLAPEDGNHWAALGMAYYRADQWPDALRALEEAGRRQQPANRIDLLFLAMTHWQMDHKDKARERYGDAVTWMDKHPVRDPQLERFRAEAAQLLGLDERPKKEKEESPRKD
jgi:serine/threonine protein kinase/tetratricopeptide (TPR) repeat protein